MYEFIMMLDNILWFVGWQGFRLIYNIALILIGIKLAKKDRLAFLVFFYVAILI